VEQMSKQRPYLWLAVLNVLGFIGVLIVNTLAVTLPINNKTTGGLSDNYPNLFVPAGLTFSIWGLIYLLLCIFSIYQLIQALKKEGGDLSSFRKIGYLYFFTSIINISWIFAWHYQVVWLSVLIMLAFLLTLIGIYNSLKIGKGETSRSERYLVHLPFSIYLGWISVATIANITALLVDLKWNGFGLDPQIWTVVVIVVAIALALIMMFTRKDIFYSLVVDWALLGILLKRLSITTTPAQAVIIIAIVGLAVISAGMILQILRRKVY
jgi:hypothetical protein